MRKKKNPREKILVRQLPDSDIGVILKKIGEIMKERRNAAGSLEDVSYEIGISRSALARYEKGGDMQLSNFLRVLYGLNIETEEFFADLNRNLKKQK